MDAIEPLHSEDGPDFDDAGSAFGDSAPRPIGSTPLEEAVLSRLDEDKAQDIVLIDLKGKSAMVLRDRHPEWGKVVGRDKTFWARGHCVSTVGLNEETIRRYVAEQEDGSRFE